MVSAHAVADLVVSIVIVIAIIVIGLGQAVERVVLVVIVALVDIDAGALCSALEHGKLALADRLVQAAE